jgi:hypothetical protein
MISIVTLAPSETLLIPVLDKSSGMQKLPAPEPVAKFRTNPPVELVKLSKEVGFCTFESAIATNSPTRSQQVELTKDGQYLDVRFQLGCPERSVM